MEREHGDALRDREREEYRRLVGEVRPLPHAHRLLRRLHDEGTRLVLASSSKAAANAGIPCVGLLTGGFSREELRAAGARAVYDELDDLLAGLPGSLAP